VNSIGDWLPSLTFVLEILDVAQVKPYKKRRLKVLANERKDLLQKLEETGLILAHHI
jgi:hypothetical protein